MKTLLKPFCDGLAKRESNLSPAIRSPSPQPSPLGRGRSLPAHRARLESSRLGLRGSLSLGERVRVRGNGSPSCAGVANQHWLTRGLLTVFFALALAPVNGRSAEQALSLWYRGPATRWLEALPVGNGRLGAMVFGGVERERLALNESTVWSGAPSDRHDNPSAREHLAEMRRLLFEGNYVLASALCAQHLFGRQDTYGTHLPMADLLLDFDLGGKEVRDYRRELELDAGIARVEFTCDGARYTREVLASHPGSVIAVRLTCDKPGRLSFTVKLNSGNLPGKVSTPDSRTLALNGQAREKKHSDGLTGVNFACQVRAMATKGKTTARDDCLEVEGADAVTLLIAANTSFRNPAPESLCRDQLAAAARKTYRKLRDAHMADSSAPVPPGRA